MSIRTLEMGIKLTKARVKSMEKELEVAVAEKLIASGLSCRELASKLDLSAAYISDLMHCHRHISATILEKIKLLGD